MVNIGWWWFVMLKQDSKTAANDGSKRVACHDIVMVNPGKTCLLPGWILRWHQDRHPLLWTGLGRFGCRCRPSLPSARGVLCRGRRRLRCTGWAFLLSTLLCFQATCIYTSIDSIDVSTSIYLSIYNLYVSFKDEYILTVYGREVCSTRY